MSDDLAEQLRAAKRRLATLKEKQSAISAAPAVAARPEFTLAPVFALLDELRALPRCLLEARARAELADLRRLDVPRASRGWLVEALTRRAQAAHYVASGVETPRRLLDRDRVFFGTPARPRDANGSSAGEREPDDPRWDPRGRLVATGANPRRVMNERFKAFELIVSSGETGRSYDELAGLLAHALDLTGPRARLLAAEAFAVWPQEGWPLAVRWVESASPKSISVTTT